MSKHDQSHTGNVRNPNISNDSLSDPSVVGVIWIVDFGVAAEVPEMAEAALQIPLVRVWGHTVADNGVSTGCGGSGGGTLALHFGTVGDNSVSAGGGGSGGGTLAMHFGTVADNGVSAGGGGRSSAGG